MKRSLLVVFMMAIILALMVPLSFYVLESEQAFTHGNLIFINTTASS